MAAFTFESLEQRQLMSAGPYHVMPMPMPASPSMSMSTLMPVLPGEDLPMPLTSVSLDHGVLHVRGSFFKDTITVNQDSKIRVTLNGVTKVFNADKVKSIVIDAGAGDDEITMDRRVDKSATIRAGAGNDHVIVGAVLEKGMIDAIWFSKATHTVFGGDGNDTIECRQAQLIAYGEAGNDTIRGGALSTTIDGGAGDDVIVGTPANDTLIGGRGN